MFPLWYTVVKNGLDCCFPGKSLERKGIGCTGTVSGSGTVPAQLSQIKSNTLLLIHGDRADLDDTLLRGRSAQRNAERPHFYRRVGDSLCARRGHVSLAPVIRLARAQLIKLSKTKS